MFSHMQWYHVSNENNSKNPLDEDYEDDNDILDENEEKKVVPWYIIRENNSFRQLWNFILAVLLIYTGTIFPYRLCFVELAIMGSGSDSDGWAAVELVVDILFYCDLCIWFFFTFKDKDGQEIMSLNRIVRRYLQTYFMLNVVACIPPALISAIIEGIAGGGDGKAPVNKSARLSRLQRISRLARLARLTRLTKLFNFILENPVWKWVQSLRFIRIINFIVGLFWTVHLVACGWYLTATFHTDNEDTWLHRRGILYAGPFEQWMHANYFVLTVFTTVGFGDMSATTMGEIAYVCFTMIIGAVIHSVIMSEVINIVVQVDQAAEDLSKQKELVKDFTNHAKLSPAVAKALMSFFDHTRSRRHHFDKEKVKNLLTSCTIPRELLGYLIHGLFDGDLETNQFITACLRYEKRMPPRFPLLVALHVNQRYYMTREVVYCAYDSPWNLFLVLSGTFAYVAFPSENGGVSDLPPECIRIFRDKTSNSIPRNKTGISGNSGVSAAQSTAHSTQPVDFARTASMSKRTVDLKRLGSRISWHKSNKDEPGSPNYQTSLSPYQLFGPRTYFGDIELLMRSGRTRVSSARCESEGSTFASSSTSKAGHVLVLPQGDLVELMRGFVPFGLAWQSRARRRDEHRQAMMHRLTRYVKYKELAVLTIQRYVRKKLHGDNGDVDFRVAAKRKVSQNRLRTVHHKLNHAQSEHTSDFIALREEMHQALSEIRRDLQTALGQEPREDTGRQSLVTVHSQDSPQASASRDIYRTTSRETNDTNVTLLLEATQGNMSDSSLGPQPTTPQESTADAREASAHIPIPTIKKKEIALL